MKMPVFIVAIATDSGVPIFTRKRGDADGFQFSAIASLNGVNLYSKCRDVKLLNTKVPNGTFMWKEYLNSITLIGIATGGLENDLELLLPLIFDVMVLFVGVDELKSFRSVDKVKRDLRSCYTLIDLLMESLDPSCTSASQPTLFLDLVESIICTEVIQLQNALDTYAQQCGGRWGCVAVGGRVVASTADWESLSPQERKLLVMLMIAQSGTPLRDTAIYLPYTSPNVAFRAITCKLLADVYVLIICGPTPALSEIDDIVLSSWQSYTEILKTAKQCYPRNFPENLNFESGVLGILLVNISMKKCIISRSIQKPGSRSSSEGRALSGTHRLDILRTFYVRTARDLLLDTNGKDESLNSQDDIKKYMVETYWCSEYHKCHAYRSGNHLCCILYSSSIPTHTMRLITKNVLQEISSNKDIIWS